MHRGYVIIHRKIEDWEWYADPNVFRLFTHLLFKANFRERKWQGITIKAGQVITGREALALQTGLTEQQIRTALNKLKSTNEITIETNNKYSIITITNYGQYNEINQQETQPIADEQPSSNQPITTPKTLNHYNPDKELSPEVASKPEIRMAFDLFNETAARAGIPLAQKLNAGRESRLKGRLRECGGLEGWKAALEKLEASDFCTGRKTSFKASLDFMLQESSFTKLMEGNYDNGPRKSPGNGHQPHDSQLEGFSRAADEHSRMRNQRGMEGGPAPDDNGGPESDGEFCFDTHRETA